MNSGQGQQEQYGRYRGDAVGGTLGGTPMPGTAQQPPQREAGVPGALATLGKAMGMLEDTVTRLVGRLEPILNGGNMPTPIDKPDVPGGRSLVDSAILGVTQRLRVVDLALNSVFDRLEI